MLVAMKPNPKTLLQTSFRHVNLIESLNEAQLAEHGYYQGYACAHGHLIRDSSHHWCYECAKKILSNVCGFDINYLQFEYKTKYHNLWNMVEIGEPDECWSIKNSTGSTPKRVCMPSYRAWYTGRLSDNVNVHKAIYQCAWGDVGDLPVTRLCGNGGCANPLHMVSTWNRTYPPSKVYPLVTKFDAEKLMLAGRRIQQKKSLDEVVKNAYKMPITNPQYAKDAPEYNEENDNIDI